MFEVLAQRFLPQYTGTRTSRNETLRYWLQFAKPPKLFAKDFFFLFQAKS